MYIYCTKTMTKALTKKVKTFTERKEYLVLVFKQFSYRQPAQDLLQEIHEQNSEPG